MADALTEYANGAASPNPKTLNPLESLADSFYWQPATATPAANTDAVIYLPAEANKRHAIAGIALSYTAVPVGGRLVVSDGGVNRLIDVDVTAQGLTHLAFTTPLTLPRNTPLEIRLYAAGAACVGKVAAYGYKGV